VTKTSPREQNTGIGSYQTNKANKAKRKILKALADGKWHRNMELKEKTRLSSRTLTKHLNWMKEHQLIKKKADTESGKYPIPVYYKATAALLTYIRASIQRQETIKRLEESLDYSKDPLLILEIIHVSSQLYFLDILRLIQNNENITNEEINFHANCFLWENYKQYTSKLIYASRKIIKTINIDQLESIQTKRQIEITAIVLKNLTETEQQKNKPQQNS